MCLLTVCHIHVSLLVYCCLVCVLSRSIAHNSIKQILQSEIQLNNLIVYQTALQRWKSSLHSNYLLKLATSSSKSSVGLFYSSILTWEGSSVLANCSWLQKNQFCYLPLDLHCKFCTKDRKNCKIHPEKILLVSSWSPEAELSSINKIYCLQIDKKLQIIHCLPVD